MPCIDFLDGYNNSTPRSPEPIVCLLYYNRFALFLKAELLLLN